MINYILSFFWNTRSTDLMLGLVAFILIFVTSSWLPFPVLHKLMLLIVNVAVIALIIIFQPELRVALSKLSLKGKKYREITEFDNFLDQLANSAYKMGEKQIGALIVLERDSPLDDFAKKAIMLNAEFSSELVESIFARNAPLHDGAIIIRDRTILAASVILPLADTPQVQRSLGTRHRAAIGLTLSTDAVVIVVSEETGRVSIAREGMFTRGIKSDRFRGVISSFYKKNPGKQGFKKKPNLREWMKK